MNTSSLARRRIGPLATLGCALVFACGGPADDSTDTLAPPDSTQADTSQADTAQDVREDVAGEDVAGQDTVDDISEHDARDTQHLGDAVTDAVTDAATDTITPAPGPWSWCPDAAPDPGDPSWPLHLEVTGEALYCGLANEGFIDWENGRILWAEQRDHRAQMWVAPGTYRLPDTPGTYPFALPLCFALGTEDQGMWLTAPGELVVSVSTWNDQTYLNYHLSQPVVGDDGAEAELDVRFNGRAPAAGTGHALTLDGSPFDPFGEDESFSFYAALCEPDCQTGLYRGLDSCHFEGFHLRRHTVTFAGGEVEFDLRYGVSAASTEPGRFLRAAGTLDDVAFERTDYWDLVYTPAHHHFERHFMVLLDPPIGSACALSAQNIDEGWAGADPDRIDLTLHDCALAPLESRKVESDAFTLIEP